MGRANEIGLSHQLMPSISDFFFLLFLLLRPRLSYAHFLVVKRETIHYFCFVFKLVLYV